MTSYVIGFLAKRIARRLRQQSVAVESGECARQGSTAEFRLRSAGLELTEVATGAAPNANPLRSSVNERAGAAPRAGAGLRPVPVAWGQSGGGDGGK